MYNLNPYMCNNVIFNYTMHMHRLYTNSYKMKAFIQALIKDGLVSDRVTPAVGFGSLRLPPDARRVGSGLGPKPTRPTRGQP